MVHRRTANQFLSFLFLFFLDFGFQFFLFLPLGVFNLRDSLLSETLSCAINSEPSLLQTLLGEHSLDPGEILYLEATRAIVVVIRHIQGNLLNFQSQCTVLSNYQASVSL